MLSGVSAAASIQVALAASVEPCLQLAVVQFHNDVVHCVQAGAEIVLADRDQDTTLRRLSRAALLYQQRPEGLPIAGGLHRVLCGKLCSHVVSGIPAATCSASLVASPACSIVLSAAHPGHPRPMAGAAPPSERPKPDEVLNRMTERQAAMLMMANAPVSAVAKEFVYCTSCF